MSAAIGAALKKIAIYILTDKKALKVVGGIVVGLVIIIIMPIVAIFGVFNGNISVNTDRLHEMISEQQTVSSERWATIETAMTNAEYDATRIQEAQALFVYALYNYSASADFTDKLVGCFSQNQTDAELINAVNSAFGTQISAEDFTKVMASVRAVYIDTSSFIDPSTKNNLDLVKWAELAHGKGWGYVWGTYGSVLDEKLFENKISQYPDTVGNSEDFIRQNWLGGRTADCVGLIKGYSWYDVSTGGFSIGSNGMPDIGADKMYGNAAEKGTIDTIPEIPGLAVWHDGHIGIYIGNGEVIHAANTNAGVVRTPISQSGWTHWLKIPYIQYI